MKPIYEIDKQANINEFEQQPNSTAAASPATTTNEDDGTKKNLKDG